mmetsp:Transcript_26916/g.43281  ORF Transcript_26916/g.43281 Transcript_26916/m.43281 type:complete len:362 (-) Transcript_26916:254-1339(-)
MQKDSEEKAVSEPTIEELRAQIDALQGEIQKLRSTEAKKSILGGASKNAKLATNFVNLKERKTLTGHFGKICAMQWSRTGKNIVSAAQDGKLIIWSAFFQHKLYVITLNSTWVMTCGYSPDGQHVASGGLDNNCTIYRLGDHKYHQVSQLRRHDGYLSTCNFTRKDEVLTSSGDKTCILWDLKDTPRVKSHFYGHNGDVVSTSIDSTNPNMFVSGSSDKTSKLWDTRKKDAVMTFRDSQADVSSVDFMAGANAFISGSEDGVTRLYDLRTYKTMASYIADTAVTSLGFSKTGRYFFAGYDDEVARVWSTLDTGETQDTSCQQLSGHSNRVSCLGVEPEEGKALCTGDWGTGQSAKLVIWST